MFSVDGWTGEFVVTSERHMEHWFGERDGANNRSANQPHYAQLSLRGALAIVFGQNFCLLFLCIRQDDLCVFVYPSS